MKAEIRIFGEIGWEVSASEFIAAIDQLGEADLDIRINSVGGSVFEGLHIFNRLKMHAGSVTATIEGLAASMASVIAMAASRVEMVESSLMMIHNPATSAWGDQKDLEKAAETLAKIKDVLVDAYLRSGKSREEIATLMDEETWFTAAEAVENGFADIVVSLDDEQGLDIAACLKDHDTSWFAHTPVVVKDKPTVPENVFILMEPKSSVNPAASPATAKEDPDMDPINKAAADAAAAALTADSKRRKDIRNLFAKFPGYEALCNECEDNTSCTFEDARGLLLDAMGKESAEPLTPVPATTTVDARDNFRAGVELALTARAGLAKDDSRNEFRGMSLSEIAKSCAVHAGVDAVNSMRRLDYVGAAFSHSSSDFPYLLENVMNKTLRAAYEEWPSTWQEWADTGEVSDFKQVSRVKLGSFNNLDLVRESGEFKEKTFGEEKETLQATTKGNIFAITRQAIINDDLSGFTRIATMLGRAARRTVNADVYAVLTANATMSDGVALFNASHNNLAGSGTAISATSIGAGKLAMRSQKFATTDDAVLNIMPDILLVPAALEDAALTFITSETDNSQSNSKKPNIYRGTLRVISDPTLDADSATAWYLLSSMNPIVEAVFLDGVQVPFLDSEEGFTVDGVRWKVRLDYGTDSIDFRGGYKNAGA